MPESSNQSQLLQIQKPNNNNKRNIIVALAVVGAVIGILVWSPWVTAEFAQMKLKSYSPCPNLGIGIEYSSPESSTKTFFGRKLTKVDVPFCGTFDFFISATGSVHQMRVYKNEAKETTSPTKKDETADWKTYTSKNLGIEFKIPKDWDKTEENLVRVLTWSTQDSVSGFHILLHDNDKLYIEVKGQKIGEKVNTTTDSGIVKTTRIANKKVDGLIGVVEHEELPLVKSFTHRVYVNANDKFYEIYAGADSKVLLEAKVKKFFYQILETFKFLD